MPLINIFKLHCGLNRRSTPKVARSLKANVHRNGAPSHTQVDSRTSRRHLDWRLSTRGTFISVEDLFVMNCARRKSKVLDRPISSPCNHVLRVLSYKFEQSQRLCSHLLFAQSLPIYSLQLQLLPVANPPPMIRAGLLQTNGGHSTSPSRGPS